MTKQFGHPGNFESNSHTAIKAVWGLKATNGDDSFNHLARSAKVKVNTPQGPLAQAVE
jgi:hypothetical protein